MSFSTAVGRVTVTLTVWLAGAVWFVPAPTAMVILTEPLAFAVTVTSFPSTLTVAMLVLPDVAVIDPSPGLVTVITPDMREARSSRLLLSRVMLPAAGAIAQLTSLASMLPSGHSWFASGVNCTV